MTGQAILILGGALLVGIVLAVGLLFASYVRIEPTPPAVAPSGTVVRRPGRLVTGDRDLAAVWVGQRYGTVSVTATHLVWDGGKGDHWAVPIEGVGIIATRELIATLEARGATRGYQNVRHFED
jgi:hypothetical protein